jgi:hypothetical protein
VSMIQAILFPIRAAATLIQTSIDKPAKFATNRPGRENLGLTVIGNGPMTNQNLCYFMIGKEY